MSLDGYIAGPTARTDSDRHGPRNRLYGADEEVDTFLIGRKTFDAMGRMGNSGKSTPGIENIVISRTLMQADYPRIRVKLVLRNQRVYARPAPSVLSTTSCMRDEIKSREATLELEMPARDMSARSRMLKRLLSVRARRSRDRPRIHASQAGSHRRSRVRIRTHGVIPS